MADKCVIFFSDNAAVVDIINKQTSKNSAIMVLLRDLVLSCLRHNILFQGRHILGFNDSRADYLSRSQVTKFQQIRRRQISHSNTREPTAEELVSTLNGLLSTSLTDGSRRLYQRAWSVFREFYAQFLWFGKPFFAAFSILYSAFYFISFFSETSFFYNHFLSSGHFVCT